MKLSIITINLNNRIGLQRTIESVINQTFTDYEWIVIDGGSTDGSKELIERYSEHFAYWVSEPDKGIYNAMNKGISHAQGDWLQFLNSGDWLYEKNTLDKIFSKEYEAAVIYGDVAYIDSSSLEVVSVERKPDKLNLFFLFEHTLCHQSVFFNKSIFDIYKYDEKYRVCSDWELLLRLFANNFQFIHIPIVMVNFILDGFCDKNTTLNMAERHSVLKNYIPFYFKNDFEVIEQIKHKNNSFHSHKSIIFLIKCHEIIIAFFFKIITTIERIRIRFKN